MRIREKFSCVNAFCAKILFLFAPIRLQASFVSRLPFRCEALPFFVLIFFFSDGEMEKKSSESAVKIAREEKTEESERKWEEIKRACHLMSGEENNEESEQQS